MPHGKQKVKMISLKTQLQQARARKHVKVIKRIEKAKAKSQGRTVAPFIWTGNPDSRNGIPYRGKDRFSGQFKKFNDRIFQETVERDGKEVTINRLMVYSNNKYKGDGTLDTL